MRSSHREVIPCICGTVLVVVARFLAAWVLRLCAAGCCSSTPISAWSIDIGLLFPFVRMAYLDGQNRCFRIMRLREYGRPGKRIITGSDNVAMVLDRNFKSQPNAGKAHGDAIAPSCSHLSDVSAVNKGLPPPGDTARHCRTLQDR